MRFSTSATRGRQRILPPASESTNSRKARPGFHVEVLPIATSGITLNIMPTISLKLPPALLRELEAEATTQGVSKSQVVRQFLQKGLRTRRSMKKRPSCLDLVADLAGAFNGPADLSTNPSYLDEALTAEHRRGRKNHR